MKKFFEAKIPVKLGAHFAKWTYENGCTVQLCYTANEFFDGEKIMCYTIVPEEKEAAFVTEFKSYVK